MHFDTSNTYLRNCIRYRNGRPLFEKDISKYVQTCRFGISSTMASAATGLGGLEGKVENFRFFFLIRNVLNFS